MERRQSSVFTIFQTSIWTCLKFYWPYQRTAGPIYLLCCNWNLQHNYFILFLSCLITHTWIKSSWACFTWNSLRNNIISSSGYMHDHLKIMSWNCLKRAYDNRIRAHVLICVSRYHIILKYHFLMWVKLSGSIISLN